MKFKIGDKVKLKSKNFNKLRILSDNVDIDEDFHDLLLENKSEIFTINLIKYPHFGFAETGHFKFLQSRFKRVNILKLNDKLFKL